MENGNVWGMGKLRADLGPSFVQTSLPVAIFKLDLFSQGRNLCNCNSGDTSSVQENLQGFYKRSHFHEVLLVLRRRTRDGQVAYQLLGRTLRTSLAEKTLTLW